MHTKGQTSCSCCNRWSVSLLLLVFSGAITSRMMIVFQLLGLLLLFRVSAFHTRTHSFVRCSFLSLNRHIASLISGDCCFHSCVAACSLPGARTLSYTKQQKKTPMTIPVWMRKYVVDADADAVSSLKTSPKKMAQMMSGDMAIKK